MIPGNFLRDNAFMDPAKKEPDPIDIKVVDQFADKNWRMTNLYYILDENAKEVRFIPNDMQRRFFTDMWYLNVLLKARQHGFTTAIDLWILDECIFYPNQTAGIIAHNLDDVKKIFRRKIKHPYERLPDGIRIANPAQNDSAQELTWKNGSEISVGTSMRSGTMNYLHVSEFGKISANMPDKADEIVAGSFNTVHQGNYVFVESTAQGSTGQFADLCTRARNAQRQQRPLSRMDFKFLFYPWWQNPKYALPMEEARYVVFTRELTEYFQRIENMTGQRLSMEQRAWYVKKKEWNGDLMKREYPSTADEAFEQSIKGAYFSTQMAKIREERRITKVPHESGLPVDTWWDLGLRDKMAIWFVQNVGREIRLIYYWEGSDVSLTEALKMLTELKKEKGYHYRHHLAPHDMEVRELTTGKSRWMVAKGLGYKFQVCPQVDQDDQIEAARNLLSICWFDAENCAEGIEHLDNFRKEWNESLGVYMEKYRHDEHSHGASAFMTGSVLNAKVTTGGARARPVNTVTYPT